MVPLKTITLKVRVDPIYKWVAQQPWGQWTMFTKKPHVFTERLAGRVPAQYWSVIDGSECDLTPERELVDTPDWKSTLRRI